MRAMLAADAAEVRGDAAAALAIIERSAQLPQAAGFWRPWRVRRLQQLTMFGAQLPAWVTSRWVLAQASQSVAVTMRGPASRALRTAVELRGGLTDVPGIDQADRQCVVIDHDWVFRQLHLYEESALSRFCDLAPADLLAGAGDVQTWAAAPMRGLRLVARTPTELRWRDLASAAEVAVPNLGGAVGLGLGETVLGRLVPVAGGQMLDAAPLPVPEEVAADVAVAPECWVAVLRQAAAGDEALRRSFGGHDFELMHDVPRAVWLAALGVATPAHRSPRAAGRPCARRVLDVLAERRVLVVPDLDEADGWACLGAAIVEPEVAAALSALVTAEDALRLDRLADRLVGPARHVCLELADLPDEAA